MRKAVYPNLIWASFVLASCGGGGGSSGDNPVSINLPPSIVLDASSNLIDEGQSVTLDASRSSDPDGDPISFLWVQKSGPTVQLENNRAGSITFAAPEVSQDETAEFEVQVSDGPGNHTNTRSVTLNITNIVQTPVIDLQAQLVQTLSTPEPVLSFEETGNHFIAEKNRDGELGLLAFGDSIEGPVAYHLLFAGDILSDVELLSTRPFPEDTYPGDRHTVELDNDHARILLQDEDVIIDYTGAPGELVEEERLEIKNGPCSITDNFGPWALIRTEAHGRIYQHNTSAEETHTPLSDLTIDHTRDLLACHDLNTPDWKLPYWDVFGNREIKVSEIHIPALAENPDLQVVGAEQGGFGVLLVLTDGQHENGDHRIVWFPILTQIAEAVELERWSYGVPSFMGRIDQGSGKSRYLVTSSSTPHMRVYDIDINGVGLENPPPWGDPSFYEVGLGATRVHVEVMGRPGFLVMFKDKQKIDFYDWVATTFSKTSGPSKKSDPQRSVIELILDRIGYSYPLRK